ncbi:MAG TPA: 30S ribosomal protein S16 [Candidatus Polarisedimenticolia bacterium]|nr:30S ribosomal protein S16 [Candidatus Polarisedimenticolia bacterium]
MLRIRMSRQGSTHRPFYRFVVSDSRKRPSATAVDTLGFYDPMRKPVVISLDVDKAEAWIRKGAVPSQRVLGFIRKARRKSSAQG